MKFLRSASKRSFLFTLSILFLVSCSKDIDIFTPNTPRGDIKNFFDKVQSESIITAISGETNHVLVTDNETLIRIPENAFVHQNGTAVTGNIDFEIIEVLDKSLMMLYDVPTVASDDLLESDAVYYINAYQNGEELELAPNKTIRFQIPEPDFNNQMQVFYGRELDGRFSWELGDPIQGWDDITINEWEWQDSFNSIFGYGYDFEVVELNWINVDIFNDVAEDQKTEVCVALPEIYTNTNTIVFMSFDDIKSVVGLAGDPGEMLFCEPYGMSPIGYNVTFVAISDQGDGIYHFGTKAAVLEKDHYEFMVLEEKTLEEILDILSQF